MCQRSFLVALALTGLVATSCGSDSEPTFGGDAVLGVEEALADADRRMLTLATSENANLHDEARCYLSYATADTDQLSDLIRCGPVLFEDSAADRPWMLFEARFLQDDSNQGGRALQLGELRDSSTGLSDTERLWRPDGAEPPDSIELAVPLPPPVEPTFIDSLTEADLASISLSAPADPELRGYLGHVRVRGHATTNVLHAAHGTLVAPEGHQLHLLDWDSVFEEPSATFEALAIDVDGSRRPLNDAQPYAVFVAPDGANVELYLRDEQGVEHRYDLLSGTIVHSPAVYYRNRVENISESYSLPFTLYSDAGGVVFDGTYPTIVSVERAVLVHRPPGLPNLDAGEGMAWLLIDATDSGGNGWFVSPTADEFTLTLADGTEIPGTSLGQEAWDAPQFFGHWLGWPVPVDFEEGTVSFVLGRRNHDGDMLRSHVLDYGETRVEIAIRIGR